MRRFARLRDFAGDRTFDTRDGLRRLGECLRDAEPAGKLGFVIGPERAAQGFVLDMRSGDMKSAGSERDVRAERCSFVVWICSEDVLRDILSGALSPLEALARHQLRHAGSEEVGIAILRAVVTDASDVLAPCREVGDLDHACR